MVDIDERDRELLQLARDHKVRFSCGLFYADDHRRETGTRLARLRAAGLIAFEVRQPVPATRHLRLTDRGAHALEDS